MKSLLLGAVLLVLTHVGCAFDRRQLIANRAEYELYRQSQVADSLEERLQHAWTYLKKYPDGEFRKDVRAWFQSVETDYYVYARPSRKRLRAYLGALPDGPHASDVRARIAELEQAAESEKRREQQVFERVRAVGDRLESAEASRKRFLSSVAEWITRLSGLDAWGEQRDALEPEFLAAFLEQAPAAKCGPVECVKQLTLSYQIPVDKKLSERVVVFDVILSLGSGGLSAVELTGPDLFSRLAEAVQRVSVSAENAQARAEAIGASQQFLATLLEQRFPEADCATEAVSPVVLARACQGARVTVLAAPELGGEDRVLLEPHSVPDGSPATSPNQGRPAPASVQGQGATPRSP